VKASISSIRYELKTTRSPKGKFKKVYIFSDAAIDAKLSSKNENRELNENTSTEKL
jgi:hypothetical protein